MKGSEVPQFSEEASEETPFFVYDPIDFKFFYFASLADSLAYLEKEILPFYQGCEDVQWVTVGRISHVMKCGGGLSHCAPVELTA